ncbi:MAG TPA: hypothetical protein VF755_19590 [Catenuloplanes sp.]
MITTTVNALAADALFVSHLQPSQDAPVEAVQAAITAMILLHGSDGCAAAVAAEFGDHPEAAVRRMLWARAMVCAAARPRPQLARSGGSPARR